MTNALALHFAYPVSTVLSNTVLLRLLRHSSVEYAKVL